MTDPDRRRPEQARRSHDRPFAGLRVFDASQGLAGPYCTALLARHGADVMKLEPPEGDWSRGIGTRYGAHSALSLAANRGKRSLALDMKQPAGREVAQRIARQSDVFVESFRPGVAERLGLGWEALSAQNPELIYLSVSGYGQEGPYALRAGTDTVVQAYSGMMAFNRDVTGRPQKVGFLVVDTQTGLYAYHAVATALYARAGGAGGRRLDVSLMQASAAFLAPRVVEASLEGESPRLLNAPAGVYRTSDGWIAITLSKEGHFPSLCAALECPDLLGDPRYASFVTRADNVDTLVPRIEAVIATRSSADWLARFAAHEVLANPVNTMTDWFADPHVQATAAASRVEVPGVGEIAWPRVPGALGTEGGWPVIGGDGPAVLHDCGFADDEIAALRASRVLVGG